MFVIVLVALLQVFVGSVFLEGWLRARPVVFMLFWFVCAWITLTAVLLSLYDALVVRARARAEVRRLRKEFLGDVDPGVNERKSDHVDT